MIKKLLRWVGFTILGVFLALLLLPFIFEDEIKEGLKQAINENLEAEVNFDDIHLSFIRDFPDAMVTVDKLAIKGQEEYRDTVLFLCEEMQISLSLASVINKSTPYELTNVSFKHPYLNLINNLDSISNYLIVKESDEKPNYEFALRNYEIESGEVRYNDYINNTIMEIKNVSHQGRGRFDQDVFDLETLTTTDHLNLSRNGIPLLVDAIVTGDAVLEINTSQKKYSFMENKIKLNNIDFILDGFLQYLDEAISMQLNITAPETDFNKLYSLIPYAYTADFKNIDVSGQGNIFASIQGIYQADGSNIPNYEVDIAVTNGKVKYPMLPKAISGINAQMKLLNTSGNVDDFTVDISLFRFAMENDRFDGRLSMKGPGTNKAIDLNIKCNISFNEWKDALPLKSVNNLQGAMRADLTMKADRNSIEKKNYGKILFNGQAEVNGFKIEGDALPEINIQSIIANAQPSSLQMKGKGVTIQGSDANFDVYLQDPLNAYYNNTFKGKIDFQSSKVNTVDFISNTTSKSTTKSKPYLLPVMDLEVKGNIGQVLTRDHVLENMVISGQLSEDKIIIREMGGTIKGNSFKLDGLLTNLSNYVKENGILEGSIRFTSDNLNFNDFIAESQDSIRQSPNFQVPKDINLSIDAEAATAQYGNWKLVNAKAKGGIRDAAFVIEDFTSNSLGGVMKATGMYQTFPENNPKFSFKLDMSNIGFKNTFQSIETFRYMAPLADYISGYFNTTLVIESELNDKFAPVINTINASGFLETLEGKISGFGPLSSLGKKLGIDKLSDWAITNSRNWFEVVDGMVELKDHSFNLGNDISVTAGGKHGLGTGLNYHFLFEIPREYLRKNRLTGVLEQGLSALEKQAGSLGINLQGGDYLLLNVGMSGNISNPVININPVGKSSKKLDDMAKEELKKKEMEVKENIEKAIDQTKSAIIDSIKQKEELLKDTINKVIKTNTQKVQDSISKILDKKSGDLLDSLKTKTALDSSKVPVIDIAKDKAKKEIDDIKKKLEKFDPLKKKKKGGG